MLFYDAPTPSGVFDDFLAIPAAGGNGSTKSFSNFIQSEAAQFVTNGLRLVLVQSLFVEYGLTWMFSLFYDAAPVTDYSPAVFDAFVNQTKVSILF